MARLLKLDKRSEEDVRLVIEWATHDGFWKQNILSASSLREKFDRLWVQMNSERQVQVKPSKAVQNAQLLTQMAQRLNQKQEDEA
jgi:hypothetical protein